MTFRVWIILVIWIGATLHNVYTLPTAGCPQGVPGSVFIADSYDACVYYWCVDGSMLHGGASFPCAPGSGVPINFISSSNPCTLSIRICGRSISGSYAQINSYPTKPVVHKPPPQVYKPQNPWPWWIVKVPIPQYQPQQNQNPYGPIWSSVMGKEGPGTQEFSEGVAAKEWDNQEDSLKNVISLGAGIVIRINPERSSAKISMSGPNTVDGRLNSNKPFKPKGTTDSGHNLDTTKKPNSTPYYTTDMKPNSTLYYTTVSPTATATLPLIKTTQKKSEMDYTSLPPTVIPSLENSTDSVQPSFRNPGFVLDVKDGLARDYAYEVPSGGYEVPSAGYEVPYGGYEVPSDVYEVPANKYDEEPLGEIDEGFENNRPRPQTESLFTALHGYFIPHGIPMVGIKGLSECLRACVDIPEVCAGLDFHGGIQQCWLHVAEDECTAPLETEDSTIHFRFTDKC